MKYLKITLSAAIVSLAISAPIAEAQRINTTGLSCSQARDLVDSRGAIVLSTGRNTFDRFVANQSFCPVGDYTKRAYAPTLDRRSCSIGYICTSQSPRSSRD